MNKELFEKERNRLIGLAERYEGQYNEILKAIKRKEEAIGFSKNCITILDDIYPEELKDLECPPFVLFYHGNPELLKSRKCAIVGSRNITDRGKETTIYVTNKLKRKFTIVSGLAKGVDAVAHIASLDCSTIAVLGSGIDYIYPIENKKLYDNMIINHLIISEYPGKTKPYANNFRLRNRIISALSEFVVVTQALLKSGTFITVNYAIELGRNVYSVPYHISENEGIGNNQLIEEGANILTKDTLEYLQNI